MNESSLATELRTAGVLLRRYALAVLAVWKSFWLSSRTGLALALSHVTGRLRAFLIVSLLLTLTALPDWIVYESGLIEEGQASVGSHWRLAFLLGPMACMVCGLARFRLRVSVFLVVQALTGLLLLLGFFFPGTIHTDIKLRSDYSFHWSVFGYGVLWLAATGTGYAAIPDAPLQWASISRVLFDGETEGGDFKQSSVQGTPTGSRAVPAKAEPRHRAKRGRPSSRPRAGRTRKP